MSPTTPTTTPIKTPKLYSHSNPRVTVLPHLTPLLPSTLPLVRRIQFHFQSPHAHVLSTFPAPKFTDGLPQIQPTATLGPFAAAYVDRSRAPETECWIFSTLESRPALPTDLEHDDLAISQVFALLVHIAQLSPAPALSRSPRILLGAIHSRIAQILMDGDSPLQGGIPVGSGPDGYKPFHRGREDMKSVVKGHSVPFRKFLFTPAEIKRIQSTAVGADIRDKVMEETLEALDLEWDEVREEKGDFEAVIDATPIPREKRTLRLLPNVALRRKMSHGEDSIGRGGEIVAWAFLGVDGSLTSLHIAPELRRKGLGKAVSERLFALLRGIEGEGERKVGKGFRAVGKGEVWCHSDVAVGNPSGVGVARSLGGCDGWYCYWCWVDLDEVVKRFSIGR